jgi:hypothetical protein
VIVRPVVLEVAFTEPDVPALCTGVEEECAIRSFPRSYTRFSERPRLIAIAFPYESPCRFVRPGKHHLSSGRLAMSYSSGLSSRDRVIYQSDHSLSFARQFAWSSSSLQSTIEWADCIVSTVWCERSLCLSIHKGTTTAVFRFDPLLDHVSAHWSGHAIYMFDPDN